MTEDDGDAPDLDHCATCGKPVTDAVHGFGPVHHAYEPPYGVRTGEDLREAAARVARWTYVPSTPSKQLDLARDIAELRDALAAEIAADQVEAWPGLPVADDELDPLGTDRR